MKKRSLIVLVLAVVLMFLVFSCQLAKETVEKVVKKVIKREVVPTCLDSDGDGFNTCEPNKDCDDNNVDAKPGINEICGDSVDNNCDGAVDEGCCVDSDGDSYGDGCFLGVDCDDNNVDANPSAVEVCDKVDNDCDGVVDEGCVICADPDGDGYGDGCELGPDCDDFNANANPGAVEVCDKVDNNCDGNIDEGMLPPLGGLVAWYKGEGDAVDSAGLLDGSLREGAEFVEGKVGQGFKLDGKDDYVYLADSSELHLSEVTVEAWIKLDNPVGPAGKVIFDGAHEFGNNGYSLYLAEDGTLQFFVPLRTDPLFDRMAASETVLGPGIWYHVAGTYGAKHIKVYVNGVIEGDTLQQNGISNLKTERRIGGQATLDNRLSRYFDGVIDELSIYDRALSPSEIKVLYETDSNGKCA